MTSTRFDELTRALANSTSRRQALKALATGASGLLALHRFGTALAKMTCQGTGNPCSQPSDCCTKLCYAKTSSGYVRCDIQSRLGHNSSCLCVSPGPGMRTR